MSEAPPDLSAKPPILPRGARAWMWLAAKLVISGAILATILSHVDFSRVASAFAIMSPSAFALAVAAMFAANCLAGLRWSLLTARLQARMSATQGMGLYLPAVFVGQILPSTLGVDAVRAWLAGRKFKPASQALGAVIVDRAFGLVGLVVVLLLGLPRLLAMGDQRVGEAAGFAFALVALGVLAAAVVAVLLLRTRLTGRLAQVQALAKTVLSAALHRQGMAALAISPVIHGLLTFSIIEIAAGLSAPIAPLDALATVPAAMLISTVPISINGWGLREGAMVACLGLAGVSASHAFVVSILFGIGQLLAALPGAAYWIFARKR